ncbi:hypothetical protein BGC07_17100 [Piscirickettsia litoralis]|uniref:Uncharacterized protein n=2 Tax=Piscirickettsia litoralis TaxID=1891921 RepID=A0ABX2ZXJ4_9GAMM|nr:hypothetical protein BGC07_17100 [Piscirickettsia litoralis]
MEALEINTRLLLLGTCYSASFLQEFSRVTAKKSISLSHSGPSTNDYLSVLVPYLKQSKHFGIVGKASSNFLKQKGFIFDNQMESQCLTVGGLTFTGDIIKIQDHMCEDDVSNIKMINNYNHAKKISYLSEEFFIDLVNKAVLRLFNDGLDVSTQSQALFFDHRLHRPPSHEVQHQVKGSYP